MRYSRLAIAALVLPLLAAGCKDLVTNETMGPQAAPFVPSGGAMFTNYMALGTSISAGVQSGGINDSTQQRAFPVLLATAMGFTPGTNWFYPSFPKPGCTPPFLNPLTTPITYVGGTATTCTLMNPAYVRPVQNNLGVPSIRLAQVLKITDLTYPATDTLAAALFITGGRNPIDLVKTYRPGFVTLELGADDVLHAATYNNAAYVTPVSTFMTQFSAIADTVQATGAKVAVANIPNVTLIPHFSAGVIFYCLHNGFAACGNPTGPAVAPYSSPNFSVDASCLPGALGGVGDTTLVAFKTTATITGALSAGGGATLNCSAGTATYIDGTGPHPAGPVLVPATVVAIAGATVQVDSFIHLQAIARGWAYVDLNGAFAALVAGGQIPRFPNFQAGNPPTVNFGTYFSLDGIHPSSAGHKAIADAFVAAINAKYGTNLVAP